MAFEVEGLCGTARHERTGSRVNDRDGYRARALDTRLGTLELNIPKLRQGTCFPPFLEPRNMFERALAAVVQEARIGGVSARRVDELVQALGMSVTSKSQVSKLCREIDDRARSFLDRPLAGDQHRYLSLQTIADIPAGEDLLEITHLPPQAALIRSTP